MPKVDAFQDLTLDPDDRRQERWRWLYESLRAAIVDGRLRPGQRLPSTRNLAAQYELSRGTVTTAFEQLRAEGYTQAEIGSGTYVASGIPDRPLRPARSVEATKAGHSTGRLGRRTEEALKGIAVTPAPHSQGKAFRAFEPAIDLFPFEVWARTAARVLRAAPPSLYGQGDAAGYQPLRRAIAEYVGAARGVRCTPDQIIVTAGAQQALDLVGRLLLDPGDAVWMEDPAYPAVWQAWRVLGATVVPVPIDGDGLIVEDGRRLAPQARIAYVTPANQFPLGVTMSAERRMELLDWAAATGGWVIEDDYDAEYRYTGHPLASLQSLDRGGSVIYVGTFTKMLFNALRLGFVVLPDRLVEPFVRMRSVVDRHPPSLDQAILAEFIGDGHFARHVRRMRQAYGERSAWLKETADRQLGGLMTVDLAHTGMRTIGWLQKTRSDQRAAERARELGLETVALSSFAIAAAQRPGLMLGFASIDLKEISRGVGVLRDALRGPATS